MDLILGVSNTVISKSQKTRSMKQSRVQIASSVGVIHTEQVGECRCVAEVHRFAVVLSLYVLVV